MNAWALIRPALLPAVVLCLLAGGVKVWGDVSGDDGSGLPRLGKAPDFALTDEKGGVVELAELRGRVVLVNFMFTRCYELCPLLTTKLATIQDDLAAQQVEDVYFVSITVDPEHDRPEVLEDFAEAMDYRPESWAFLTGDAEAIEEVANAYGVVMAKEAKNMVNHNLLTTVVDRDGVMRVQYLGERFDPEELLRDILDLAGKSDLAARSDLKDGSASMI